jgi:magnesium-transporting ATPase (P-type)
MVKKMKYYSGMRVAGIGDGGNDVGMIQEALAQQVAQANSR